MLSLFSSRASTSLSLRLLHQQSIHPCFHGPHILQQSFFWHRLSQEQNLSDNIFILPLRSGREGRTAQLRDAALKYFLGSFTDGEKAYHNEALETQVISSWQADGKESHFMEGEVKFTQREKVGIGLGNGLTKLPVEFKNVEEEGVSYRFIGYFPRRDIRKEPTDTDIIEGSLTETSKKVNLISVDSIMFAEVHTVRIRRKLTKKFLLHLQEKIDFLHSVAVPVIQVKSLLNKRAFLSASPEKLVAVLEVLTEIFESKSIAFDVLKANAGILTQPLEMLKQRMHVFLHYGVDRRACIRVATAINMWTLSVQKCEQKLYFLKELGMDAQVRSNVLFGRPRLLAYSESNLRATVEFLESIGFCGTNLLKFLESRPSILCTSVDRYLAVRLKLCQDWGFSANDIIRSLRYPHHSVNHIKAQFKLFRDEGFSESDASSIIRRRPLASTTKDLKAKLDFLRQVHRDISEVVQYPSYLTFSLEHRIIPRFKALEAVSLSKKPCLHAILVGNTSVFKRRFNIPETVEYI